MGGSGASPAALLQTTEPTRPVAVGALTSDEVQVIQGALDLANKTAEAVMTPLGKASMHACIC